MDLAYLERLLDLVARAPIAELELAKDGWRIRLVKAGRQDGSLARDAGLARPQNETGAASGPAPASHVVSAGLVGVFYRAPAPGQPPFVSMGDIVTEGQTLGLLEAMKMLSPIEADRSGRITAIVPDEGASVQAGDPLFMLDPSG